MQKFTQMDLQQVWMEMNGPQTKCSVIHPNTSCIFQIMIKCASVVRKSSKLYAALYLAMFVLQFQKIRRQNRIKKSLVYWVKDYFFSLAFMSWMVGGMKTALCILNNIGAPLDGRSMPLLSLIGSTSIFFNDRSRRGEITNFVFVRACRSAYVYLKKRWKFPITRERQLCFVAIFAVISYLYFEGDKDLKNRQLLNSLWGEV